MIVLFQILIHSGMPFWHYLSTILTEITTRLYCSHIKQLHKCGVKKILGYNKDDNNIELKFIPSLKTQKYLAIQDILRNKDWKKSIYKAVEFGYTDLHFFKYGNNFPNLNTILEVNINSKYKNYQINNFKYSSFKKFDITLLSGCIKDPDMRLLNTDLTIALNVIEYLYPNILEAVPYNIFGFSMPSIVIFSTFNADLKYIFPSEFQSNTDRQFEWTRDQFVDWAYNITSRFPSYVVFFEGIGSLPVHPFINLGAFTEVAIFYKLPRNENQPCNIPNDSSSFGICTYMSCTDIVTNNDMSALAHYYKYITESFILSNNDNDYNFIINCVLHEIAYKLQIYGQQQGVYYNYNRNCLEIPVTELYKSIKNLLSLEELILLLKQYYVLENRLIDSMSIHLCVIWDLKTKPVKKLTAISRKGTSDSDWETISVEMLSQEPSKTSISSNNKLNITNPLFKQNTCTPIFDETCSNNMNNGTITSVGGDGDQFNTSLETQNEMFPFKKTQFDITSRNRPSFKNFEKYSTSEINKYYSTRHKHLKNSSSCGDINDMVIQYEDFVSGKSIASLYHPLTLIIESRKSNSSSR